MFIRLISNTIGRGLAGVFALMVIAATMPAASVAQDVADKSSINKIEVKDGQVFVNGEMVKELENADLPVVFNSNGNSSIADFNVFKSGGSGNFVFDSDNNKELTFFGNTMAPDMHGDVDHMFERYNVMADDVARGGLTRLKMNMNGAFPDALYNPQSDEIRKMERESMELARRIRTADDAEQEDLKQTLKELLSKIFDLKEENTVARLNKMSAELDKLEAKVAERSSSRTDIINRRYKELLGESDALAW